MAHIAFYEVEPWMQEHIKKQLPKHSLCFSTQPLSSKNCSKAKKANIVVVFIYSKIDEDLVCELPNVQMIATTSTGYDHIDKKVIDTLTICNVPAYGQNSVAEHAFMLILAVAKKLNLSQEQTIQGSPKHSRLIGMDLRNKTIGVVGTGNIGKHVIEIAQGFGMKILAHDPHKDTAFAKKHNVTYVSFNQLLKKSDIITFHAPLLASTKHMLNSTTIQHIKPGAIVINTARGGLIDSQALLTALKNKVVFGAGLDVFEEEHYVFSKHTHKQLDAKSKKLLRTQQALMKLSNVVVTPHNAFNTKEALMRILTITADNIKAFLKKKPQNIIK